MDKHDCEDCRDLIGRANSSGFGAASPAGQPPRPLAASVGSTGKNARFYEAFALYCVKHMGLSPAVARLSRIAGELGDHLTLSAVDTEFIAGALDKIVSGDDAKKALEIGGRQFQGRVKRSPREADRRREDVRRAVYAAYVKSRDDKSPFDLEAGIDTVAKQLVIERGYNRRTQDDSAITSWHGHLEDCCRELGAHEIERLLNEMIEDDFIKAQTEAGRQGREIRHFAR